jgi:hypothetical protein
MEHLRAAEPHEQTPEQFLNRPDTFVHGRFIDKDMHPASQPHLMGYSVHAGTRAAALDRLEQLGAPRGGRKQHARFFAGTVDPKRMHNPPPSGDVHDHGTQEVERRFYGGADQSRITMPNVNEWRARDQNEEWTEEDHDKYYRNQAEDVGSTSVILSTPSPDRANFKPWRRHVSDALAQGKPVPKHVEALYHASGGAEGSVYHTETEFHPEVHINERRLEYGSQQSIPNLNAFDYR